MKAERFQPDNVRRSCQRYKNVETPGYLTTHTKGTNAPNNLRLTLLHRHFRLLTHVNAITRRYVRLLKCLKTIPYPHLRLLNCLNTMPRPGLLFGFLQSTMACPELRLCFLHQTMSCPSHSLVFMSALRVQGALAFKNISAVNHSHL